MRNYSLTIYLLLLSTIFFLSACSLGLKDDQSGATITTNTKTGSIKGYVVDNSDTVLAKQIATLTPISYVRVYLLQATDTLDIDTTDASGSFGFDSLAAGSYSLYAVDPYGHHLQIDSIALASGEQKSLNIGLGSPATDPAWPPTKYGIRAYRMIPVIQSPTMEDSVYAFPSVDSLLAFFGDTACWPQSTMPASCKPLLVRIWASDVNSLFFPDSLLSDSLSLRTYYPGNGSGSGDGTWNTGGCMLQTSLRSHEQIYCWPDSLATPTKTIHLGHTYRPDWPCSATDWSGKVWTNE